MKNWRLCWLTFLFLLTGAGCATRAVWDGRFEACNTPASEPGLRLFDDAATSDLLVVYTEYSERRDATHTRAYFLHQNETRLAANQPPKFVNPALQANLPPVPVFLSTNPIVACLPKSPCAVLNTNGQDFTFYSGGLATGTYDLPTYNDGKGRWERAAVTPFAVGADATLVGGVLAYWYLECRAGGAVDLSSFPYSP